MMCEVSTYKIRYVINHIIALMFNLAVLFHFRDNMDNSPLHLAASNGYTRSMKLLLTVYPNLLDCCNKDKVISHFPKLCKHYYIAAEKVVT